MLRPRHARGKVGEEEGVPAIRSDQPVGGGLVGAGVIGLLFDGFGWTAAVGGVFVALGLAAILGLGLRQKDSNE